MNSQEFSAQTNVEIAEFQRGAQDGHKGIVAMPKNSLTPDGSYTRIARAYLAGQEVAKAEKGSIL
jgi:hypothetical protein